MNWTIALPEIVLSCIGMAILVFGVLRKQDSAFLCTMFTLGGFLVAAFLVLSYTPAFGYHGQFVTDAFSAFNDELILAGAALSIIVSLDYNRKQHISRFEFPVLMLFSTVGMMVMVSASTWKGELLLGLCHGCSDPNGPKLSRRMKSPGSPSSGLAPTGCRSASLGGKAVNAPTTPMPADASCGMSTAVWP